MNALYTLPAAAPTPSLAPAHGRGQIAKVAQEFEASFLSVMLGQVFSGVETAAPFGGGQGEAAYKSFLTDAFAKSMAKHGGLGVAKAISAELLKLQGLS